MNTQCAWKIPAAAVSPIARADEADTLLARVAETMDALSVLLRQETELVRAGRLRQAADCEKRKSELMRFTLVRE